MAKVLRVGSANVGSMSTRYAEVVNISAKRRLDFCCLQETRWRGQSSRCIKGDGVIYKCFWKGCKKGTAGVGVLVAEKWINSVIEVRKISERLMVLRVSVGERVLNLLTVYAPQVGRLSEEKAEFFIVLYYVGKGAG